MPNPVTQIDGSTSQKNQNGTAVCDDLGENIALVAIGSNQHDILNTTVELRDVDLLEPNWDKELMHFTASARSQLNGALIRCEERYPDQGHHSVLYVVVKHDVEQMRSVLQKLHEEHFGYGHGDPLAPVRLEVVDQATEITVQRLMEAGLIKLTSRSGRPLYSAECESEQGRCRLSAVERERVQFQVRLAGRKLKVARVVLDAGLEEDARTPLLEAVLALSRSFAIQLRLPAPGLIHEALLPPISPCWRDALLPLREFSIDSQQPCRPVLDALAGFLTAI